MARVEWPDGTIAYLLPSAGHHKRDDFDSRTVVFHKQAGKWYPISSYAGIDPTFASRCCTDLSFASMSPGMPNTYRVVGPDGVTLDSALTAFAPKDAINAVSVGDALMEELAGRDGVPRVTKLFCQGPS